MNLYGIKNRSTIGTATMVADSRTTGDYVFNRNLKYVTCAEDSIGKLHIDVRKMYAYLAEQAVNSETSNDIKSLEIAKITLDFLVRGVYRA